MICIIWNCLSGSVCHLPPLHCLNCTFISPCMNRHFDTMLLPVMTLLITSAVIAALWVVTVCCTHCVIPRLLLLPYMVVSRCAVCVYFVLCVSDYHSFDYWVQGRVLSCGSLSSFAGEALGLLIFKYFVIPGSTWISPFESLNRPFLQRSFIILLKNLT